MRFISRLRRREFLVVVTGVLLLGVAGILLWPRIGLRHIRAQALKLAGAGRWDAASPLLKQALEARPDDLEVLEAQVKSCIFRQDQAGAEAALDTWCRLQPENPEPRRKLFDLHLRLGQHMAAMNDGLAVLRLEESTADFSLTLGRLCLALDRPREAEEICRKILRRQPGHSQLAYLLAESLHAQGKSVEAQDVIVPLLRRFPDLSPVLMLRAHYLLYTANRPAEAEPILRKIIAMDRERQMVARYHLGQALARMGRTKEAETILAEVNLLQARKRLTGDGHPENLELSFRVAEALMESGKPDEARPLLDKILAREPGHGGTHRLLAAYYEKTGQPGKAREHRQKAEQ